MSDNLLQLLGSWLSNSWNVITSFIIPGTNFSLAAVLLGAVVAIVSVRILIKLFGAFRDGGQRGGNNGNIEINEDRRLDVR